MFSYLEIFRICQDWRGKFILFSFLLLQHGESEFNTLGKIGGDANLSPRGRMYAAALARYFNEASVPNLRVWTSEKKRTKQTAQDIRAPKEPIAELNELDAVSESSIHPILVHLIEILSPKLSSSIDVD